MVASKRTFGAHKIVLEATWWGVTILLTLLILFPILHKTNAFPLTLINSIAIVAFITIFRYTFFLKYTYLAHLKYLKIVLIFLSIPIIFNLINNLNYFISYLDELSYEAFLGHLNANTRNSLETYIRSEMLLFSVGSIIAAILLPFRLIVSLWRQRNRGTV